MIDTVKKVVYKAFGLKIWSDMVLPELVKSSEQEDNIDMVIEVADLSKRWSELATPPKKTVVTGNLFMFQLPNIATFAVQDGKRIIVSPMQGSDESQIRLYILGTCMGALLMQRKVLPLHGSAVAINGKAYAFIGESGAGKSTLASAFLRLGYPLISDDVIAISLSSDRTPLVMPSYPQQKLWQESLKEFDMETKHYRPIYQRETKYSVPVPSHFSAESLPLAGVYELVKTEKENIEIQRIEKLERLNTLFRHTYRNFLIPRLGLMEWHFNTSARIVNHFELYQLSRPASRFTASHLASLILKTIQKEE